MNYNWQSSSKESLPFQILIVFLKVIVASQQGGVDLTRFMSGEYFINDCSEKKKNRKGRIRGAMVYDSWNYLNLTSSIQPNDKANMNKYVNVQVRSKIKFTKVLQKPILLHLDGSYLSV